MVVKESLRLEPDYSEIDLDDDNDYIELVTDDLNGHGEISVESGKKPPGLILGYIRTHTFSLDSRNSWEHLQNCENVPWEKEHFV